MHATVTSLIGQTEVHVSFSKIFNRCVETEKKSIIARWRDWGLNVAYFRIPLYLPFAVKSWTWELLIWVIVACVHQHDGSQKHSLRTQKAPPWNSAQTYCLHVLSLCLRSWKRNCCFYKTVFQMLPTLLYPCSGKVSACIQISSWIS